MKKIAAIWVGKDKNGNEMETMQWDRDLTREQLLDIVTAPSQKFMKFKNTYKTTDKHPDFNVLVPDDDAPPITVDAGEPPSQPDQGAYVEDDIPF